MQLVMLYNPACIVCYLVRNKHQVVYQSEQGTLSLLHRASMQIIARVVLFIHLQKSEFPSFSLWFLNGLVEI